MREMQCRKGCGACCIAPSISSSIPGMPHGKPAGVRCIHLTNENLCGIYAEPDRPEVCSSFQAAEEFCGDSRVEALEHLARLDIQTLGPMGP